jgi:hypothetical protein
MPSWWARAMVAETSGASSVSSLMPLRNERSILSRSAGKVASLLRL